MFLPAADAPALASACPGPSLPPAPEPLGLRVQALVRVEDPTSRVQAWRLDEVRLEARTVLATGLAPVHLAPRGMHRPERVGPGRYVSRAQGAPAPVAFSVPGPRGPEPATFLVAEDPATLAHALGRLVDVRDEGLCRLVERVESDERSALAALTSALQHGASMLDEGFTTPVSCVIRQSVFEREWSALLEGAAGGARAIRAGGGPRASGCVLVAETTISVRGRAVPRRVRVQWLDLQRHTLLVDDGATTQVYRRGLTGLPEGVLERLDRAGELRAACEDDLPDGLLAARCLVRIPPRRELLAHLEGAGQGLGEGASAGADDDRARGRGARGRCARPRRPRRPRSQVLRRPGLVRDSRAPIALNGREPVFDDPNVAAWLLGQTTGGVFVPDDAGPRPLAPTEVPADGAWLVLCDAGPL